jgi:prefoldin subunit 5
MRDGFAGVGEAIERINNRLDKCDKAVDQRLTKLEQQMAA